MKRAFSTVVSLAAILAGCVIAAPAASATAAGCGDLDNGQLCLTGGSVGKTGEFTFTAQYDRHTSGEITLTLGSQRKNSKITALPLWFGTKTTHNGFASISKRHHIDSGDCIRGVMDYKGTMYVTKWRCP